MPHSTEARYKGQTTIDRMEPVDAVSALIAAQCEAAATVGSASAQIARAAHEVAQAISTGHRVVYSGAGSSGLMAMADALELPGTFGVGQESVKSVLAGGVASLTDLAGGYEDDAYAGAQDMRNAGISAGDCAIVVAASGRTPYALGAASAARSAGAIVVAIANNPDTPLLKAADIPILLSTPSEPVAGSTRLGAGTAQKIALNAISTMAGTLLGHVHDGMMVNLRADNAKLRDRAVRIVCSVAETGESAAREALEASGGAIKSAILLARGAGSREDAEQCLARAGHDLRTALGEFQTAQSRSE